MSSTLTDRLRVAEISEEHAIPAPMVAPADLDHRFLPVSSIDVSPTNPRKHFDQGKLDELRESILRVGVVQPIIVRPVGDRFELVAGERRLRATREALLDVIPAVVKDLGDKDAFDIQLTENAQRVDLHPLEEAEGFATALRTFGYDVDALADKIGKSKSYVYGRMKLAELCDEAKASCYDGSLPHSHALEIARIPDPRLQKQVLTKIMEGFAYHGQARSFRELKRIIQSDFQLHLKKAKFDTTAVIEAKGALPNPCTVCPNRSGNQADLFDDFTDADVCTLPPCFRAKEEFAWQESQKKNAAKGVKVLTLEQGKKIAAYGYVSSQAFVGLNDTCPGDSKQRKVSEIIGKEAPVAICRGGDGRTYRVIARKDLAGELASAGIKVSKDRNQGVSHSPNRDYELDRKITDAVQNAIAAAVEIAVTPEIELTILRRVAGDFNDDEGNATKEQILGALAANYFGREGWNAEQKSRRKAFLDTIGIDLKAIAKNVTREHKAEKEEAAAKPEKKKTSKKKAKAAKSGTCTECGCTDAEGCAEGCSWVNDAHTLCSECAA